MRKSLEMSILYNLVESSVLKILENNERFNKYYEDYIDKDIIDESEINSDVLLCYRYLLKDDRCIDVLVEKERIILLLLDSRFEEIDEYVYESEELCDIIYW